MTKWFTWLVLLLPLISWSQPNPINRRAMAIAGLAVGPRDIPSSIGLVISNRWISTSLDPTNKVPDWIDETNHFHLTQPNSTLQPTNSPFGIRTDKDTPRYLNSTNVFVDPQLVYFFVCYLDGTDAINHLANFNYLSYNTNDARGFSTRFDAVNNVFKWYPGNEQFSPSNSFGWQDVITAGNGGSDNVYVNGVQGTKDSGNTWLPNVSSGGYLGHGGSSDYFIGWIKEVIVYTNQDITSLQVSNLHYYRTNVYGGSP